jgi:hypothetical protein
MLRSDSTRIEKETLSESVRALEDGVSRLTVV